MSTCSLVMHHLCVAFAYPNAERVLQKDTRMGKIGKVKEMRDEGCAKRAKTLVGPGRRRQAGIRCVRTPDSSRFR